jgi:uncharacterized membrane protein YvlD (DUF360 family)
MLWMITLGLGIFTLAQILVIKGLNFTKPKVYILPKAIQALSFVILAWFLSKRFHISGMAFALLGSSILYFISVIIVNQKILKIKSSE